MRKSPADKRLHWFTVHIKQTFRLETYMGQITDCEPGFRLLGLSCSKLGPSIIPGFQWKFHGDMIYVPCSDFKLTFLYFSLRFFFPHVSRLEISFLGFADTNYWSDNKKIFLEITIILYCHREISRIKRMSQQRIVAITITCSMK